LGASLGEISYSKQGRRRTSDQDLHEFVRSP
jgi:hypothetical protein